MKRITSRDVRRQKTAVRKQPPRQLEAQDDDATTASDEYTVGRGKPPKRSQFKKGQSGNPKGRPKGSKKLSTILDEALSDHMRVTLGGETRTLTKKQVAVLQLVTQAVQGDLRALFKLFDFVAEFEQAVDRPIEYPFSAADSKVIHTIYARLNAFNEEEIS